MDDFFSFVSKAVIIIPIVVLIISLVLKFNQPKSSTSLLNTVAPTTVPVVKNNSFKFDLKGSIVCDNLFIKDKKVFYTDNKNNYLLNGDCLYQWQTGKFNGTKKCGLSSYINLAENYAGLLNISDLAGNSTIAGLAKDKGINVTDVLSSCKKGEIKDNSMFEIPRKILFK